jgi:hypothetical protein
MWFGILSGNAPSRASVSDVAKHVAIDERSQVGDA